MKLNPEYRLFDGNMFVQMRALLADVEPAQDLTFLDMSIGEPQLAGGATSARSARICTNMLPSNSLYPGLSFIISRLASGRPPSFVARHVTVLTHDENAGNH